jgi:uncharacterized protein (TIGR02284 family)
MGTKSSIEQLNEFLRGEISAVETYQMALSKVDDISTVRDELLVNLKSHQDRVMLLQDAIRQCGGEPATSSGPWGVFAKAVEGGAKLFGKKAAISALEEGEDHGLSDYRDELEDKDLDFQWQSLVRERLLPQQQATHDRLSDLKKRL